MMEFEHFLRHERQFEKAEREIRTRAFRAMLAAMLKTALWLSPVWLPLLWWMR